MRSQIGRSQRPNLGTARSSSASAAKSSKWKPPPPEELPAVEASGEPGPLGAAGAGSFNPAALSDAADVAARDCDARAADAIVPASDVASDSARVSSTVSAELVYVVVVTM